MFKTRQELKKNGRVKLKNRVFKYGFLVCLRIFSFIIPVISELRSLVVCCHKVGLGILPQKKLTVVVFVHDLVDQRIKHTSEISRFRHYRCGIKVI